MTKVGNSQIMRTIPLLITIFSLSLPAYAKYSGGTGEPDDPYQIATAGDLMLLGNCREDYDKYFKLIADIDLAGYAYDRAVIAPVDSSYQGNPFTGVFDGNGYTISHLTIIGESYLGLFGQMGTTATVFNLGLVSANVSGTDHYVGGLVGYNRGSIATSYSSGSVNGNHEIGGLVGFNHGRITTSYSSSSVSGRSCVGGLVGYNWMGSIDMSYSSGSVSSTWVGGGLVGYNAGSITSSFWDTQTSGQTTSAGGTGLTTALMQNINTYLNEGWDFIEETSNGTSDYWQISLDDYPRLYYHRGNRPLMPEGLGTPEQPYLIRDARDLGTVWTEPLAHYRLAQSVDLSGITWSMATIPWFGGTFDGNGYVISNLHIEGERYLGLFGRLNSTASIFNLGLVAANVSGDGYVGGLVGDNDGSITTSFSNGHVISTRKYSYVGGLVAYNSGSIAMSYSSGSVSGYQDIGGLVGYNYDRGSITTSYSIASVSGTRHVGGLVGGNNGSITSSFWDTQTSGRITSSGGTGLSTVLMQNINTYLNAGWDFIEEISNGTCDYWQISPDDYPKFCYHSGNRPLMQEGLGTGEHPHLIRDAQDLGTVWFKPLAHYRLAQSVDLSGITWSMATIPWFGGTFDGNGHVISNLHIEGDRYLGLFGQLGYTASVSNLGIEAIEVNGWSSIGGLVGSNNGIIVMSYTSGSVIGGQYVGGLIGWNSGTVLNCSAIGNVILSSDFAGGMAGVNVGTISECHFSGSVTGPDSHNEFIGGLVGRNGFLWGLDKPGMITDSFSTGNVVGGGWAGGLVGHNEYGSIATCYSTATVSASRHVGGLVGGYNSYVSITTSFWDIETSGQTTSAGGIGKTTSEMQMANTFLEAGWDFVDETANGTEDIWWILEGQDYPRLWWEAE